MNIIGKKQTHRHREQTNHHQWERGAGEAVQGLRGADCYVLNRSQEHIVQRGECSLYFIIVINGV